MNFEITDIMVKDLHLSGNELLLYGLLSVTSPCEMSVREIGEEIGVTTPQTTRNLLKSLEGKGLIIREVQVGTNYIYSITSPGKVSEVDTPPQEVEPLRRERSGGSDKFNPRRELFKRNGRELE